MQTFEPPRFIPGWRQLASIALLTFPLACTAEIGGSPTSTNTGGAGAGGPGGAAGSTGGSVGPSVAPDTANSMLRRLNRSEYDNTVRDLLGTSLRPASQLPNDETVDGFDTIGEALSISLQHIEVLERGASELVDELFALPATDARRNAVLTCQPTAGSEDTCARQIFAGFTRKAFRRPVTEAELTGLLQLARQVSDAGHGYEEGLKAALRSILLSPNFLFLVEKAPAVAAGTVAPVSDHELAVRLSYFLWSSMPDAALFAAAEAGSLSEDPATLTAEVERLLADEKAQALTANFAGQWLTLRRLALVVPDANRFPSFDTELSRAAQRETELFFGALLTENASLSTLFTADFTFVNQRLGQHYGISVSGADFQRVGLTATERTGLLGHMSFLTVNSHPGFTSPTKRGAWVLEQLLCSPPPPVPPDVMGELTEPAMGETLREKLEAHRSEATCAGCHSLMDPIGLGLEHFDAIGAYRETEEGAPIDASSQLEGTPFSGLRELSALLSRDERLNTCFTQQMLTYAVGRTFHNAAGHDYAAGIVQTALSTGQGVRDLLKAVVQSSAFRTRRGE